MALDFLKNLFRNHSDREDTPPLCRELHESAERFEAWLRKGAPKETEPLARVDIALEELRKAAHAKAAEKHDIPPDVASDGAAWIGELVRERHGGTWSEHALFGLVLSAPAETHHAHLLPLHLIDKKWQLGEGLSIQRWIETLPERLAAERERLDKAPPAEKSRSEMGAMIAATPAGREQAMATERTEAFAEQCKRRLGGALPLSLQGVRELERFLRSQFFLCAIDEEFLIEAGFFLGEVGRGLYQGNWDFSEVRATRDPTRVALAWPELPYYPVGRVYKMMTEQPEGESLDEYLRLVPSARHELRKQAAAPAPSPTEEGTREP